MRVIEANSGLVFDVKDIINTKHNTVHPRRKVLCPIAEQKSRPLGKLWKQADHFEKKYHLV